MHNKPIFIKKNIYPVWNMDFCYIYFVILSLINVYNQLLSAYGDLKASV